MEKQQLLIWNKYIERIWIMIIKEEIMGNDLYMERESGEFKILALSLNEFSHQLHINNESSYL